MKKKNDIFAETIVGIFMAAVLALLIYFTIVISGVDILVAGNTVFRADDPAQMVLDLKNV